MKRFVLVIVLALAATSGVATLGNPASAQSWIDIARRPVPQYRPYRGYYGSQTYIGNTYARRRYVAPRRTYRRIYRPRLYSQLWCNRYRCWKRYFYR